MTPTSRLARHLEHYEAVQAYMDEPLFEALSSLIHKVYISSEDYQIRTVVLAATEIECGVSYLCSCMATLVAMELGPTVLVDGQLLERIARIGVVPRRSHCKQINNGPLWVFSSMEARQMVYNEKGHAIPLGVVIEALEREFKYIVIDAPALSVASIADMLSPYIDGCILVAIPNRTELQDLSEARKRLTAGGGQILGAICNSRYSVADTGEIQ